MDALKIACMWHGVAFLPHLRKMPREKLMAACTQASDLSGERVLHMQPDASSQQFEIRDFPWHRKLSGCQVIALMVYGLWVLCGEREEMCSSLCESWLIKDALMLSPTPADAQPATITRDTLDEILRKAARTL